MRNKIAFLLFLVLISASACTIPAHKKAAEDNYRSKYPYTVLGEDYGLLTEDDVAISSCIAHPSPFSLQESSPHPYWQCFSLSGSAFECEEADENEEGRTAILAVVLKKDGITNDYLSRRAIPLDACNSHKDDWVRLTSNQKFVCISGGLINDDSDKMYRSWIFESYKTAKGCDSYFQGGCNLAHKIQNGCNLAIMAQPAP